MRQTDNICYILSSFINSENSSAEINNWKVDKLLDTNTLQNVKAIRNSEYANIVLETREAIVNHLATVESTPWELAYIRRTGAA